MAPLPTDVLAPTPAPQFPEEPETFEAEVQTLFQAGYDIR